MGRYSQKLYISYSTFYVIGTLLSMQVPFVGFQPTFTSEHMAAMGIFGLIQLICFTEILRSHINNEQFKTLSQALVGIIFVAAVGALVVLTYSQKVAPWTGRFYSLWDTGYAKKYIPIIASVSEHQPTPWTSYFFDLQMLIFIFPAGIYFCFKILRNEHVFVIIYALTASYFSGVMVRLILTLTPIVCICAGLGVSYLLDTFLSFEATPDIFAEPSILYHVIVADEKIEPAVEKPASPTTLKKKKIVAAGTQPP